MQHKCGSAFYCCFSTLKQPNLIQYCAQQLYEKFRTSLEFKSIARATYPALTWELYMGLILEIIQKNYHIISRFYCFRGIAILISHCKKFK